MLSMRTGPVVRGNGQPADLFDIAALALEHADLDGILLLPFLVERDLVVAGDRQPKRIADRRHPHAEVGGPFSVDGNVNLGIRDVEPDLDLGQARHALRRNQRSFRVLGDLGKIRPEDVGRDRKPASAFASSRAPSSS